MKQSDEVRAHKTPWVPIHFPTYIVLNNQTEAVSSIPNADDCVLELCSWYEFVPFPTVSTPTS